MSSYLVNTGKEAAEIGFLSSVVSNVQALLMRTLGSCGSDRQADIGRMTRWLRANESVSCLVKNTANVNQRESWLVTCPTHSFNSYVQHLQI